MTEETPAERAALAGNDNSMKPKRMSYNERQKRKVARLSAVVAEQAARIEELQCNANDTEDFEMSETEPGVFKRATRSQRQQRANLRLRKELASIEDFTIEVLALLDMAATELRPARRSVILGAIADKRRELGFPEPFDESGDVIGARIVAGQKPFQKTA